MRFLLISLLLSGCSSILPDRVLQKMPINEDIWCPDLIVNGYQGAAVLDLQRDNELEISSPIDLEYFMLRNGKRTRTKERDFKISRGLFNLPIGWDRSLRHRDRSFKFTYTPTKKEGDAALEMIGVDSNSRQSVAYVDWHSDKRTLPANVYCNGTVYRSKGTTLCASFMGDEQDIEFLEDVVYTYQSPGCNYFPSAGRSFTWAKSDPQICTHLFRAKDKIHRLTTIICNKIPVRQ